MIFGFNTDVKYDNTVYHVQTEAHPTSHTFQSTIFVKGQCIGKKSGSYADTQDKAENEQQLHELLKEQHRHVVEAIRNGQIEALLKSLEASQKAASDFL